MKNLAICAAVLALAAPAAALAAGPFEVTTSVKASHQDLNLSDSRDARIMLARLDRAALKVCGASEFSVRDYRDAVRRSACYQDSMNQAVASLNAPAVNAIYRERAPVRLASN